MRYKILPVAESGTIEKYKGQELPEGPGADVTWELVSEDAEGPWGVRWKLERGVNDPLWLKYTRSGGKHVVEEFTYDGLEWRARREHNIEIWDARREEKKLAIKAANEKYLREKAAAKRLQRVENGVVYFDNGEIDYEETSRRELDRQVKKEERERTWHVGLQRHREEWKASLESVEINGKLNSLMTAAQINTRAGLTVNGRAELITVEQLEILKNRAKTCPHAQQEIEDFAAKFGWNMETLEPPYKVSFDFSTMTRIDIKGIEPDLAKEIDQTSNQIHVAECRTLDICTLDAINKHELGKEEIVKKVAEQSPLSPEISQISTDLFTGVKEELKQINYEGGLTNEDVATNIEYVLKNLSANKAKDESDILDIAAIDYPVIKEPEAGEAERLQVEKKDLIKKKEELLSRIPEELRPIIAVYEPLTFLLYPDHRPNHPSFGAQSDINQQFAHNKTSFASVRQKQALHYFAGNKNSVSNDANDINAVILENIHKGTERNLLDILYIKNTYDGINAVTKLEREVVRDPTLVKLRYLDVQLKATQQLLASCALQKYRLAITNETRHMTQADREEYNAQKYCAEVEKWKEYEALLSSGVPMPTYTEHMQDIEAIEELEKVIQDAELGHGNPTVAFEALMSEEYSAIRDVTEDDIAKFELGIKEHSTPAELMFMQKRLAQLKAKHKVDQDYAIFMAKRDAIEGEIVSCKLVIQNNPTRAMMQMHRFLSNIIDSFGENEDFKVLTEQNGRLTSLIGDELSKRMIRLGIGGSVGAIDTYLINTAHHTDPFKKYNKDEVIGIKAALYNYFYAPAIKMLNELNPEVIMCLDLMVQSSPSYYLQVYEQGMQRSMVKKMNEEMYKLYSEGRGMLSAMNSQLTKLVEQHTKSALIEEYLQSTRAMLVEGLDRSDSLQYLVAKDAINDDIELLRKDLNERLIYKDTDLIQSCNVIINVEYSHINYTHDICLAHGSDSAVKSHGYRRKDALKQDVIKVINDTPNKFNAKGEALDTSNQDKIAELVNEYTRDFAAAIRGTAMEITRSNIPRLSPSTTKTLLLGG